MFIRYLAGNLPDCVNPVGIFTPRDLDYLTLISYLGVSQRDYSRDLFFLLNIM